jgi:chemosensory pili system protein ChpA (sensor histidine kinase/response regulator)
MDDAFSFLDEIDQSELSEEDIAILRAFEAMDSWLGAAVNADNSQSADPIAVVSVPRSTSAHDDDTFMIFIAEAEEDIASMLQTLKRMNQDDAINPDLFIQLQRLGHKLYGTAGAIDFPVMSTLASHVEVIAEQVSQEKIYPLVGVYALSKTITALERHLHEITTQRKEPEGDIILATLDVTYRHLNIDIQVEPEKTSKPTHLIPASEFYADTTEDKVVEETQKEKMVFSRITAHLSLEHVQEATDSTCENIRIDIKHFEKLTKHLEQLVDLRSVLENAQEEVEKSLQELQASQIRLQRLEPMLALFLTHNPLPQKVEESISSSLIARILNEAIQRRSPLSLRTRLQPRSASGGTETNWDELDMERYSEKDLLLRSLKESIADVSLTTARLQMAHARLAVMQQEYVSHVTAARSAALRIRQAPLSTLIPRLERVVRLSALGQTQDVQFDVSGETTEIDQDTLEALASPLIQLLRTCIADLVPSIDATKQKKKEPPRIWLHVRETGNEIVIEIGFSMTVHGGAVDAICDSLQRFSSRMSLQRNENGGVSFLLHVPRLQGTVRCLLVRTNLQQLVIPFSQIQHVVDRQVETLDRIYHLRDLLGYPSPAPVVAMLAEHSQSVLVMQEAEFGSIGIAVDRVVGEIELFVRPLKSYLQRPGIMGMAIDGKGSVMLMIDLPALMRHYSTWQTNQDAEKPHPATKQIRVLVADDAVYLRHSVRQTLQYANYIVIEARDGMEAIEKLQEHVPEVCVLDVEMPNLNGYDVLNMVHQMPAFKDMKVIMLTSRSSEKHKLHAMELGVHAYLTKPCSQEALLCTIQGLVASS